MKYCSACIASGLSKASIFFNRVERVASGSCKKNILFDRVERVASRFYKIEHGLWQGEGGLFDRVEQQVDNYFADSEQAKMVSTVEQQLRENDYVIDFSKLEGEFALADRMGKGILDLRTVSSMPGTAVRQLRFAWPLISENYLSTGWGVLYLCTVGSMSHTFSQAAL